MLRTVALSLLMLISVGVMLPFASSTAHGIRQSSVSQHRRHRRHSRTWWRRHRARLRIRRAAAMAHRNAPLGPALTLSTNNVLPSAALPKLPIGWDKPVVANNGEIKFKSESKASAPSQATLSVIARSRPNPAYLTQREERSMLAGVSFSDLRRTVIEKMINSGGWVINDYQRQVDGARVFVVIAHTPGDGRSSEKAWNFYFAEIDGKIYSLSLNTPVQYSDRLAAEGEKFLSSLREKANATYKR